MRVVFMGLVSLWLHCGESLHSAMARCAWPLAGQRSECDRRERWCAHFAAPRARFVVHLRQTAFAHSSLPPLSLRWLRAGSRRLGCKTRRSARHRSHAWIGVAVLASSPSSASPARRRSGGFERALCSSLSGRFARLVSRGEFRRPARGAATHPPGKTPHLFGNPRESADRPHQCNNRHRQ